MHHFYVKTPQKEYMLVQSNLPRIRVGTDPGNDLVLDGGDVGLNHCELTAKGVHIEVKQVSDDSTTLGGRRLAKTEQELWHQVREERIEQAIEEPSAHKLQIGAYELLWLDDGYRPTARQLHALFAPQRASMSLPPLLPFRQNRLQRWMALTGAAFLLLLGGILLGTILISAASAKPRPMPTPTTVFDQALLGLKPRVTAPPVPTYTPTASPTSAIGRRSSVPTSVTPMAGSALPTATPSPLPVFASPTPAPLELASELPVPLSAEPTAGAATTAQPTNPALTQELLSLGVTMQTAVVEPGASYWKLTSVRWLNEDQAQGRHHIFIDVLDESGARIVGQSITIAWPGEEVHTITEAKPNDPFAYAFPMYALAPAYTVRVNDLPSDALIGAGLGTPENPQWAGLTSFELIFQRTVAQPHP